MRKRSVELYEFNAFQTVGQLKKAFADIPDDVFVTGVESVDDSSLSGPSTIWFLMGERRIDDV